MIFFRDCLDIIDVISAANMNLFFFSLSLSLIQMSDLKETTGPGRKKTVRKGMFSKDCKFFLAEGLHE